MNLKKTTVAGIPKPILFYCLYAVLVFGTSVGFLLAYFSVQAFQTHKDHPRTSTGGPLFRSDPEVGYVQVPNLQYHQRRAPSYWVFTDGRGARVASPGQSVPVSVDLLAIGCSFTWGDGLAYTHTYPHLLGQKLTITEYNVALPSYGTTAALWSLRRYADLRPKTILYGFIKDHIRRALVPCASSYIPYCRPVSFVDFTADGHPTLRPLLETDPAFFDYLKEMLVDHPFGWRDIAWTINRRWMEVQGRTGDQMNALFENRSEREKEKAMAYLMDELVAETEKIGASLVVVHFPDLQEFDRPPETLLKALRKNCTRVPASILSI